MATYSGYFFTGVPDEDKDSDKLLVYSSATKDGTYTLESTEDYAFPTKVTEYSVDEDKWYKISYTNSDTGYTTPLSNYVPGSGILKSAPSLELTSTSDGASYATEIDVYARGNMTDNDIPKADVNYSLSVARAYIDMKLSTISINRYSAYRNETARRKFNALIKLLKDVEINYALGLVYRHMADDKVMENITAGNSTSASVTVGQTSVGGVVEADSITTAQFFDALSARYSLYADTLLSTLLPNYVPMRYSENGTGYHSTFISYAGGSPVFNFSAGIVLDRMDL